MRGSCRSIRANVLNWALVNGERESGVTIHFIDEGIDTGDIILQSSWQRVRGYGGCRCGRNWPSLAADAGSGRWLAGERDLPKGSRKTRQARPLVPASATGWTHRLGWPAERIYNLIRALVKPWPGAFFRPPRKRVTLDSFLTLDEVCDLRRHGPGSQRLCA